jgi:hypothetical protein
VYGTVVSFRDVLLAVSPPLAASVLAAALAFAVRMAYGHLLPPIPRLVLESTVFLAAFFALLVFAMGQKSLYMDLLRGLKGASPSKEKSLAST